MVKPCGCLRDPRTRQQINDGISKPMFECFTAAAKPLCDDAKIIIISMFARAVLAEDDKIDLLVRDLLEHKTESLMMEPRRD